MQNKKKGNEMPEFKMIYLQWFRCDYCKRTDCAGGCLRN